MSRLPNALERELNRKFEVAFKELCSEFKKQAHKIGLQDQELRLQFLESRLKQALDPKTRLIGN